MRGEFIGQRTDPHRKLGRTARASLDADSSSIDVTDSRWTPNRGRCFLGYAINPFLSS
ncbi:MAG: hypothetical protein JNL39_13795 [Opitutaceae bacterium]|nr:hypothetical protein [Opitutaceae bacterium]